ncbi:UDP-4-amino-4,6-dideoxy-N-acetyl-beta-L-altrosamine transaminase [Thalassotalea castellviae]|uniref:UDP-4-amino-4, 6-dideoxy-N-acetyl-beta-L-altrosamine transaminase n=1 Tax=Thalassotalea castellviae TaxID=3075612 RepID=A0ABU2ZZ77_9GAMM|nr:UDP-4-amino-4,6-dideoxy-N-acetyl-beta-L-altrosamine transaminase [Thalassotalea sp. W431]MDT0602855.1 UDP-4-amino-4,6-dideoxy-N-acetyl-beta-L-altrosamine transaminase [Thalassotalea sp. W431]
MIPYGKQSITTEDINAVTDVLQADLITQGPLVPEFEQSIADLCQAQYATAVSNATAALHIANLALEVGAGDIVWTTPISFVASANCALYCGATIDFVDIDINTANICPIQLQGKLAKAQRENQLPKVLVVVHMAGASCNMRAIAQLAKQYHFKVIEDASHAIGGKYLDQPIGSCQYSDITVFSFHPVKIITSGEGGMALTNNQQLDKKLKRLRSHGITADPAAMTQESHGPWYYEQVELGFNYRMTDIHAALGLSQLNRLTSFVQKRNDIAKRYDNAFNHTNVMPIKPESDCYSAYHLYLVRLPEMSLAEQKHLFEKLRGDKIFIQKHYIPIYLQPYYQQFNFDPADYPQAQAYYRSVITLPLYPELDIAQQDYIIDKILRL